MSNKYKIKYKQNEEIKELIIVSSNISNINLPSNIISIKKISENSLNSFFIRKKAVNSKEINLIFYELNLMLQSGLVISEALDILINNRKDKYTKEFLVSLKHSFTSIASTKESLKKFNLDDTVLSFLELAQKRGNIKLNIKALSSLLIENEKIKKEFVKAIRYPLVLMVSFFISLNMIFYFVLPNFKSIYSDNLDSLPVSTKILFLVHFIYENYFLYIMILLFIILVAILFEYRRNFKIQYFIQKVIVERLYLFKELYKNMQFYRLFLVLDIMMKSNYEFHQALSSSKVLLKNQYLLDKISLIENLLKNGRTINYSFTQTKLFDDLVLNLLNSAEVSNSLSAVVSEIKEIYKNRFIEKTKLLTSIIEPIFLISLMGLILWIVLAIFMPMWDMGEMLNI